MTGGRTVWWRKDAAWWLRERIVVLGEEFGPAGPAVIDWLSCQAAAQNDSGRVKGGLRSVARGIFADAVTVGHVLSRAVTLCLVEDFEDDNGLFSCRISGWNSDNQKAVAAERKARQRARSAAAVTVGHDESRDVPKSHIDKSIKEANASFSSGAERADKEMSKASDDDKANCRLFAELVRTRNPKAKIPKAGTSVQAGWLRDMRLLRTADGNNPDDIRRIIRWLFTDPHHDAVFWGTTIQAPSGLREHFPQLWAKMAAAENGAADDIESSAAYLVRRGAA